MTTTSILPCRTDAVIGEFNGVAQRHIHDVLKAIETGRPPALDWQDKVLLEVVSKLGRRAPTERDLLHLATGSRLRLLVEARRLTYGDALAMEWQCRCGAKCETTFNLAELADRPYPEPAQALFRASSGQTFALTWGTGLTDREFARAQMRNELSFLDEPLCRVAAVDGEPVGLRVLTRMSGRVLDEVRKAGRAMVPTYDPEARPEAVAAEEPGEGTEAAEPTTGPVTDAARMPQAGCPERVRLTCESCGARTNVPLGTQPDFLLPGVQAAAD